MKIALLGYGKMGHAIEQVAEERGHTVVTRVGRNDSMEDITKADVVIEFTSPESAVNNLKFLIAQGIPTICGTTGWNDQLAEITALVKAKNGALVHASNFSLGVNIFFELNEKLADIMAGFPEYHVQMTEIHHLEKKDAPSGTAITLAQGLIDNSNKIAWHLGQDSTDSSIAIEALRENDVKGTHIISYKSRTDTLEIKHAAHNREGFAIGAIIAAEWIAGKKGVFTMKNVLGL
jgi:4-hydroxy-tetrahydrodipicolinate reductase